MNKNKKKKETGLGVNEKIFQYIPVTKERCRQILSELCKQFGQIIHSENVFFLSQ